MTLGGVDTAALSSRDCQAKAVPGLFVVGEAVDVTGWLGGYNFHGLEQRLGGRPSRVAAYPSSQPKAS